MNILFVTTTFPRFVGDTYAPWILQIARLLLKQHMQVSVLAPSAPGYPNRERLLDVDVIRCRYAFPKSWERVAYGASIPINLQRDWKARATLLPFMGSLMFNVLRRGRHRNIIHSHFGYSGLLGLFQPHRIGKLGRPLLITSFYGKDVAHAEQHPRLYRRLFKRADRILALSKDMVERLEALGCPFGKLTVLHLGVDCEKFTPQNSHKRREKIRFLVVGNFVPKKGIEYLIRAIPAVLSRVADCQFHVVGRGPGERLLRKEAQDLGVADAVRFIDNSKAVDPRRVVFEEMSQADIFVLPSVAVPRDYGGTPIVLMEASAMGIPCITTDDAGNNEIVLNEKTGLVVHQRDASDLAEAIIRLATNQDFRRSLGDVARLHMLEHFDVKSVASRLVEIYRVCLASSSPKINSQA